MNFLRNENLQESKGSASASVSCKPQAASRHCSSERWHVELYRLTIEVDASQMLAIATTLTWLLPPGSTYFESSNPAARIPFISERYSSSLSMATIVSYQQLFVERSIAFWLDRARAGAASGGRVREARKDTHHAVAADSLP